jgi:hypothetical protein
MIINREGLVGDYNYAYLFTPRIPFTKNIRRTAPFFGLHDRLPVLLAFILGLQHALAMLAGGKLRDTIHPTATNGHKSYLLPSSWAVLAAPTSETPNTSTLFPHP